MREKGGRKKYARSCFYRRIVFDAKLRWYVTQANTEGKYFSRFPGIPGIRFFNSSEWFVEVIKYRL